MLLTIDLGNTNTVFGVYDSGELTHSWRLSTYRQRTADEHVMLLRNLFSIENIDVSAVNSVIVASVVPPLDPILGEVSRRSFGVDATFVTSENAGIRILYNDPSEVGADRIVDAVAVLDRYRIPAIVVDLGTATTFDAITAEGEYLGGLISPGIEVSAAALIDQAARLPRIDIQKPQELIGRSTVASLQSGFFWGYVSLVDGVIDRMKDELGRETSVIATGGMATLIEAESRWIETTDPNLTLHGLYLVARKHGIA